MNNGHISEQLPSFYFAGKVASENNWRASLLTFRWDDPNRWGDWKIQKKGILGTFDYVGPYFQNMRHEGSGDHEQTVDRCFSAIRQCDVIFAWISESTIHGTLFELGYAAGLVNCKKIWIGFANNLTHEAYQDIWFLRSVYRYTGIFHSWADTAKEAFLELLTKNNLGGHLICESPIERQFWEHAKSIQGITPQFQVGNYRLDFAFPALKVAIELDGHDYHSSKEQRAHDAQRDRFLSLQGWRVLRFTGSEIHQDANRCVQEVVEIVTILQGGMAVS